jgi:hypothetical protein
LKRKAGQINLEFTPSQPKVALAFSHIAPAKPTPVYDSYWRFAAERQNVFFRRLEGALPPWTLDPIIKSFKFTNTYRASDRVSQYLIRNVIYCDDATLSPEDLVFRILLFKLFNKIETWQVLERETGRISWRTFDFHKYDSILTKEHASGSSIYSGAYIMPSGGSQLGHSVKHRNHLHLLELMMQDNLPKRLARSRGMKDVFETLLSYPTIGAFLAYQFAIDINYSELTDFSEMEFVMPGPGARDGIKKCFSDTGGLNEPEIVRFMVDRQELEFDRLGLRFRDLWGRRLQLIDCQNLFCEVDKFARVAHPDIVGISGRARIKQKYVQKKDPMLYWYPPKWKINEFITLSNAPTRYNRG